MAHHFNIQSTFDSLLSDCFARLRVLALNSCGIKSWSGVQLLSPHLPVIEELYLASNSLPDLPRLKAEKEYQDATGSAEGPLLTGTRHTSSFIDATLVRRLCHNTPTLLCVFSFRF